MRNFLSLVFRVDCEEIWRRFEDAVLQESSCNVTAEDYHLMFHAVPQTQACDRVSGTASHRSARRRHRKAIRIKVT